MVYVYFWSSVLPAAEFGRYKVNSILYIIYVHLKKKKETPPTQQEVFIKGFMNNGPREAPWTSGDVYSKAGVTS